MKVLIDWVNSGWWPIFVIVMENWPSPVEFRWEEEWIDENYSAFRAWHPDGWRKYMVENRQNRRGYGGAKVTLPMWDGDTRDIIGPWSSRDSYINSVFGGECMMDVVLQNTKERYRSHGIAITQSLAVKYAREQNCHIWKAIERTESGQEISLFISASNKKICGPGGLPIYDEGETYEKLFLLN